MAEPNYATMTVEELTARLQRIRAEEKQIKAILSERVRTFVSTLFVCDGKPN